MAQEWSCPHCGKKNPPQLSACGWCRFAPVGLEPSAPVLEVKTPQGQAAPLANASPAAASAVPGSFRCPHCGDNNAQRVSGLVRQDVRTESTTGAYFGGLYADGFGVHGGTVSSQTESVSVLAQLLAPPLAPVLAEPQMGFGCLLTGAGILALIVGFQTAPAYLILGLVVLPLGIGGFFWEHQANRRAHASHEAAQAAWKRQLHVWQRLNYCRRCDSVSDPDTGQHAPSNAWRPLLGK